MSSTSRTTEAMPRPLPLLLEPREVGLPELDLAGPARGGVAGGGSVNLFLTTTKLNPANLARDGLGQLGELDTTNSFVCREVLARVGQDRLGGLCCRFVAGGQNDIRLRHGKAGGIRRGHDGRLGYRRVLDQHRLELERADPVVRGLEHVIGPSHIRDVAARIPGGDITGVIGTVSHRLGRLLRVAVVPGHQTYRAPAGAGEAQAELAFGAVPEPLLPGRGG